MDSVNGSSGLSSTHVLSLILSFSLRHGLSNCGMGDMLDLIGLISSSGSDLPSSKYHLFKELNDLEDRYSVHYFCINMGCRAYIPKNAEECPECGKSFSSKIAKKAGNYFVHIPIAGQIKDLLESGIIQRNLVTTSSTDITDVVSGSMFKSHPVLRQDVTALSVTWNFDGVPIHKSSNASVWPILATINELTPKARKEHMLMLGVWCGAAKPLWSTFSVPFVDDLLAASTAGITWLDSSGCAQNTKVIPLLVVCDAPARCMVQALQQFNGEHGCTWCLQKGTVVQRGNGTARVYPFEQDVPVRTHSGLISDAKIALTTGAEHHFGVVGISRLFALSSSPSVKLDMVGSFVADYMHIVLLGVTRQVTGLWLDSTESDQDFSLRARVSALDAQLAKIRPPDSVSRLPRPISQACRWKASEWRSWLLFYSLPLLRGMLPGQYFNHWMHLVSSIYLLLQPEVSAGCLSTAERSLGMFVSQFVGLYGLEHMTYNVHCLLHLTATVRRCGPLWACSMFPFEGFNQTIIKFCTGPTHVPLQVAKTFLAFSVTQARRAQQVETTDSVEEARADTLINKWLRRERSLEAVVRSREGVVGLGTPTMRNASTREKRLLGLMGHQVNGVQAFDRVLCGGEAFCHSQYGCNLKRNNYTVDTRRGVVIIDSILFVDGSCFIFGIRCEELPKPFGVVGHLRLVRKTDSLLVVEPSEIRRACVVVECDDSRSFYCSVRPNQVETD